MAINIVVFEGRLTRDPEKRATPSGLSVVSLDLANNRKYKSPTGEVRDDVCFIGVTVWGKTGEACCEYLQKGSRCLVTGRLKLDQWEKDGQKRSKISVVAADVQFLDQRRGEASEPHGEASRPARQQVSDQVNDSGIPF